jgi:hypothetical protein
VRGAGEDLPRRAHFLGKQHGVDVDVGTRVDRQAVRDVEQPRRDERDGRRTIGEVGMELVEPLISHE